MPRRTKSHSLLQKLFRTLTGDCLAALTSLLFLCGLLSVAQASARGQSQQFGLERNSQSQGAREVLLQLKPGPAIERQLAGSESHYYRIAALPVPKDEGGRMKDEVASKRIHPSSLILWLSITKS